MLLNQFSKIKGRIQVPHYDQNLEKICKCHNKIHKRWLKACLKVLWLNNSVKMVLNTKKKRKRKRHLKRNLLNPLLLPLHILLDLLRDRDSTIQCLTLVVRLILITLSFMKIRFCLRVMVLKDNRLQSVE